MELSERDSGGCGRRALVPRVLAMPSRKFTWDPEHWRFRAEEARTVADQMKPGLAKLADEQLVAQERTTIGRGT